MTIKDVLLGKIDELNIVKDKLLKIESFLNPGNDIFVYHTLSIGDISGTTGSTPSNLAEILSVVVKSINDYTEYIMSIPNRESNVIRRDRGVQTYAIISKKSLVPGNIIWEELSNNALFGSVQQLLPMSTYIGFIDTLKINCAPSFRKGGQDGADILFEVVLIRINSRLNIIEEYETGGGLFEVTFDGPHLYGDDVFIIGFRPKQQIIPSSIYYSNLAYNIEINGLDNSSTTEAKTINNTPIGNILLNVDTSITDGILMWDAFALNDFSVETEDSIQNKAKLLPISEVTAQVVGKTLDSIKVDGISADVSNFKISYMEGTFRSYILIDDSYILYDKKGNNVERIIFKNVIPIDIILEEAINAL